MRISILLLILLIGAASISRADALVGAARQSATIDMALTEEGELFSQCQDSAQRTVAGAPVGLYQNGKLVAAVRSGEDGWFTFSDLAPGSYVLHSRGWQNPIRVWSADAAPPEAEDPIVLVLKPSVPVRIPASTSAPGKRSQAPPQEVPEFSEADAQPAADDVETDSKSSETVEPEPAEVAADEDVSTVDAGRTNSDEPPVADVAPSEVPDPATADSDVSQAVSKTWQLRDDTANVLSPTGGEVATPVEDKPFIPFDTAMSEEAAPLPPGVELAPLPPGVQAAPTAPTAPMTPHVSPEAAPVYDAPPGAWCPPMCAQPAAPVYRMGPTVGDVVIASTGIAGLTVGTIAIYKYDRDSERRPVSP